MQVTTQTVRGLILDWSVGGTGPFNATSAKLIGGPVTPTDLSDYATMNALALAFTGNTPLVITWGADAISPARQPFVNSQLLEWIVGADISPTITAYGIMYYNMTTLKGVDLFPAPIRLALIGDFVQWVCTVP